MPGAAARRTWAEIGGKMVTMITKDFSTRGKHFHIVQNEEGFYLAINHEFVTDGKLNRPLNGFQMCASRDFETCIENCKNQVEIEYLESQGYSKAEAFGICFGIPADKLQELVAIGAF